MIQATDPLVLRNKLKSLPPAIQGEVIRSVISELSEEEAQLIQYEWSLFARDNQVIPSSSDWVVWLILAGRGFGKTRSGAESIRMLQESGRYGRFALIAPTAADARDVMIEGESGILATSPPWNRPEYEPSKRRLTWPNGAIATTYSGEDPESLRGPQHDAGWLDEMCAWSYAQDTWDMYSFGLRLGIRPLTVITTTPKPMQLLKDIMAEQGTYVTRGSTYDNKANLAPQFLAKIVKRYEGTRLGRQELNAEVLNDNPGALWNPSMVDPYRLPDKAVNEILAKCVRVAVGVDPAVSNNENSAEHGIVVAGMDEDGNGYVFADRSLAGSPFQWGSAVVRAYKDFSADRIYPEVNNGGDLVESNIRNIDPNVPITQVRATRGKAVRAEPIAALYEQGRIKHVGNFPELEHQLYNWNPLDPTAKSPDRLDSLVWVLTGLFDIETSVPGARQL